MAPHAFSLAAHQTRDFFSLRFAAAAAVVVAAAAAAAAGCVKRSLRNAAFDFFFFFSIRARAADSAGHGETPGPNRHNGSIIEEKDPSSRMM
jgi:hypothetical protein